MAVPSSTREAAFQCLLGASFAGAHTLLITTGLFPREGARSHRNLRVFSRRGAVSGACQPRLEKCLVETRTAPVESGTERERTTFTGHASRTAIAGNGHWEFMTYTKLWTDMFVLTLPIAEKITRPVLVYLFLVIGFRLSRKPELAELNSFDLVVLLMLFGGLLFGQAGKDE
jgi:hypothetical protein